MADVINLPRLRTPDRAVTGPASIVLFPTTVARARWLRREGLRIAAGVSGASLFNVRRVLKLERERAGLAGPAVAGDVEAAIQFGAAVRDAADRLGRTPWPANRDGGAA